MTKQQLIDLITIAPLISLVCLTIHACIWWEGMILHFIRIAYRWAATEIINALASDYEMDHLHNAPRRTFDNDKLARLTNIAAVIIKPFYACLICMSSVWTIAAWIFLQLPFSWNIIVLMLFVCGINVVLDSIIYKLRDHDGGRL